MSELAVMIGRANSYEEEIVARYGGINGFYDSLKDSADRYGVWLGPTLQRITAGLSYVATGRQSEVYLGQEYVLKLHHRYSHMTAQSVYPGPELTREGFDPLELAHLLAYEYFTPLGLGAVQRRVACSPADQRTAAELLALVGIQPCPNNLGLDHGRPVIIDMF
jgi:hypothetical protein